MAVVVQKYGGTSVGTVERLRAVARRIAGEVRAGNRVAVVVSARGDTTDELLALAGQLARDPDRRELDQLLATGEAQSMVLLALALGDLGVPARSLSGGQAGIRTVGRHGKARIGRIAPRRVTATLAAGTVAIVAGFQGVNGRRDVQTLGRGGSDTTAVALAAALGAARCDIFTDVDGVYTADPRLVPGRASSTGSPTARWRRWPGAGRGCCTRARSSWPPSTAWRSSCAPACTTAPARSSARRGPRTAGRRPPAWREERWSGSAR